jgi:hypothetical protein
LSACKNLFELRIAGNSAIDDASIKYLLNFNHLIWLDIANTSVTCSGLKALKPLHLTKLTVSEGVCSGKDLPILKAVAKTVEFLPKSGSLDGNEDLLVPMH